VTGNDAVDARISHYRTDDGVLVVAIAGELDLSNVARVRAILGALIDPRPTSVVIDLRALTFMDSSGIATLLQVAGPFEFVEVRNASPIVQRIIVATGVGDILRVRS
jgi:anti-sigma B factor antagonist